MKKKEFQQLPIRSINHASKHGSPIKFRIEGLAVTEKDGEAIVEPHRHDFYHIMLIKTGKGTHDIDFKTYEIRPNTVFFVSPGQVHALKGSADINGYVISFDSDFYLLNDSFQKLLDFPFFHSLNNPPVIYLKTEKDKIRSVWEEIYEEYQSPIDDKENLIRSLLEVLLKRLSRVYELPDRVEVPAYLSFQLRKLEALIDAHFRTDRLLNDYANLMHLSPKHLNSLSKKGLNKTVTNLIHERTLIEAKRLLLFTNNAISEIADDLGFSDKSYFMRFFKKQTGQTAEHYRNLNAPT